MGTLDDFSYDHDTHTYLNSAGLVRPSTTETLKHAGLFDYSRIDPAVLERKRIIGQHVHEWCKLHDESNREHDDVLALEPEERGYAESHLRFRDLFPKLEVLEVERVMLGTIAGIEVGGTPDLFCRLDGVRQFIIDRKCVDAFHPGWRLQLADYVMLRSGLPHCKRYGRAICRLRKSGKFPSLDIIPAEYDDVDAAAATAFVIGYVWRKNHGLIRNAP